MATLSVVISAFNEEKKIEACLKSVKGIADEIIVVNSGSTDKTVSIAKKYTDKIFDRQNNPMLNVNKNFGFLKAKSDYILNLDPDERITPELEEEIKRVLEKGIVTDNPTAGYWIARKNIIFNKWIEHGIWWPDYQMRFFKNGKGKFPAIHVHEVIEIQGETSKLINPMIHENYQTVSQFMQKMDKMYTDNEAENFIAAGKKLHWSMVLTMPANDFFRTFFFEKGYKDGLHGLVLSLFQAFNEVIVFAKVWEKEGFSEYNNQSFIADITREIRKIAKDFTYWVLTTHIERIEDPLKKTILRIKRRLR